jgi:hypothetical protein
VDRVVTHGSHEGSMNCSMSVAAVAITVSFSKLTQQAGIHTEWPLKLDHSP